MNEAKYYKQKDDSKVQCTLCPHYCLIKPDKVGKCRKRKNIKGKLYTLNYGKTISLSIDPIEKKPLYHFYPGQKILSIGPNSCNMACRFCQNYEISQNEVKTYRITPKKLVELCMERNLDMVAYTYTEPITWFEFIIESASILKENKIKTVMVTNGFVNQEPLNDLLEYIDAMNIDLKSMDKDFYEKICHGKRDPVLNSIKKAYKKAHIEITNLIITNENDSDESINQLVDFIADVSKDIPLHFSRYFPHYKMNNPSTPEKTLKKAARLAKEKLRYVYLGNVISDTHTYCPNCNATLVKRGFTSTVDISNNKCNSCDTEIYGEWD